MSRIEHDKQTIKMMVEIYCRHHLHQESPSEEYRQLTDYACQRLDHCKFGEQKPACKNCPTHCYKPEMRERMRRVMRWVGPRMLFFSPRATWRHIVQCRKK